MGNSTSNPVRNMDKRTSRREYSKEFESAIEFYRNQISSLGIMSPINDDKSTRNNIKVFARKRPIFKYELDSSEFDVVTCFNNRLTIHDARMHNDMIRMYMDHHEFEFHRVFNETATNSLVYKETAEPLVDYDLEGGYSTTVNASINQKNILKNNNTYTYTYYYYYYYYY
jgi:hypothetical protein